MGLLPAGVGRVSAGTIRVDGTDMTAATEAVREDVRGDRIGMIFQEPMTSLNPVLPVGFQIGEALARHRGMDRKAARRRALELMEQASKVNPYLANAELTLPPKNALLS
jgi:ABC-type microcin C transport system duplicated ATPase subunit YejF